MKKKKIFTRKTKAFLLILAIGFISLQFMQPQIKTPKVTGDFDAPKEVKQIIRRVCYDCHSNEKKIKWFDKIAPFSWMVSKDISDGRKALNFSTWQDLSKKQQDGNLYTALNFILLKEMPLKQYIRLHKDAVVSTEEIEVLKKYVVSRTPVKPSSLAELVQNNSMAKSNPTVSPSLNGINYIRG